LFVELTLFKKRLAFSSYPPVLPADSFPDARIFLSRSSCCRFMTIKYEHGMA
jgi:hypothetical protein